MVQIPQIARQNIASSAVGTPGIDMSGSIIADAAQQFGQVVSKEGFQAAIQKRQAMDQTEANQIMTATKLKMIGDFEQHKVDFAQNPMVGDEVFAKQMQTRLDEATKSAPNPRVKAIVQQGDPYFQGHLMLQRGNWASQQQEKNTIDYGTAATISLGEQAAQIGSDTLTSVDEKRQNMLPLVNTLGNVVNSIKSSKRPDLADEYAHKGMKSMYQGLLQQTVDAQPDQTLELLKDPHLKQIFTQKELDDFTKGALESQSGLSNQTNWRQVAHSLVYQPDMVRNVMTGKMNWGDIDAAQKSSSNPDDPMYGYLKAMANKQYPEESTREQQDLKVRLLDEAHQLGVDVKKKTPTNNVKDLLKFSEDLISAKSRGFITNETFNDMYKQIATPLVGAVLNAHDPGWLSKLAEDPKSIWHEQARWAEDKVNRYNSGYAAIDGYLTSQGIDKSSDFFKTKAGLLSQFFKVVDVKIGNKEYQTLEGRPYTAEDVAHEIMGIGIGQMIKTPLGMRKVNGYKKPGIPTIETTPEDEELLKGPLSKVKK